MSHRENGLQELGNFRVLGNQCSTTSILCLLALCMAMTSATETETGLMLQNHALQEDILIYLLTLTHLTICLVSFVSIGCIVVSLSEF
jgi:hypothetical protein